MPSDQERPTIDLNSFLSVHTAESKYLASQRFGRYLSKLIIREDVHTNQIRLTFPHVSDDAPFTMLIKFMPKGGNFFATADDCSIADDELAKFLFKKSVHLIGGPFYRDDAHLPIALHKHTEDFYLYSQNFADIALKMIKNSSHAIHLSNYTPSVTPYQRVHLLHPLFKVSLFY